MIYLNKTSGNCRTNDLEIYTHLFEFIDENTLKQVDQLPLAIQDLMWLKDDTFIGLRRDRIRFYRVNIETGKFVNFRTITPTKATNKFIFASLDDMMNFWYAEGIANAADSTYMNNFDLNYVNSFTINKIDITKEKSTYDYENAEIETYIELKAIGDFGDIVERDIEIKITGPAKFKDNGSKIIQLKTNANISKRVDIIITGTGEAVFNAYLVKPSN
jgi:hypothetical protein